MGKGALGFQQLALGVGAGVGAGLRPGVGAGLRGSISPAPCPSRLPPLQLCVGLGLLSNVVGAWGAQVSPSRPPWRA